jgi:hypothetical protein
VTTAWPRVVAQCSEMGVEFDPWQHGIGAIALGKREDGKYAATVGGVVLSIPRQVGKTFLVGMILIALCVLNPGFTVLWTAHRTRTATMTFGSLKAMTSRKKIAPFMLTPRNTNGEQEIRFKNGSVIMFGARELGFGRGFDEVDAEVFDEAQILTEKALEDMVPAANQSRQPTGALLFFMGTPPRPGDPGEEFTNRRNDAIGGTAEDMVYVEFSADPDASPDDWGQVAKANPSYPLRTPREAILRMRKNLTNVDSFMREAMGVWDPAGIAAISFDAWRPLADPEAARGARPVFGVSVAPDRSWAAVAAAWARPDGLTQVAMTERGYRPDATWIADHVRDLRKRAPGAKVLVDQAARGLLDKADEPSQQEQAQADNALADAVLAATVRHGNDPALDVSVKASRWRTSGDTRVLDRKGAKDISPLRAVSLALWGVMQGTALPQIYDWPDDDVLKSWETDA